MSSLQPMKVQMKHPHPQMMAQGRCLGQQQTIFLRDKLKQLERLGIVECADNPVYGSAAFVVPKQGHKNGEWSIWFGDFPIKTVTVHSKLAQITKGYHSSND